MIFNENDVFAPVKKKKKKKKKYQPREKYIFRQLVMSFSDFWQNYGIHINRGVSRFYFLGPFFVKKKYFRDFLCVCVKFSLIKVFRNVLLSNV